MPSLSFPFMPAFKLSDEETNLGNILVERLGWITENQLTQAVHYHRDREDVMLGQACVILGFIDQEQLSQALDVQGQFRAGKAGQCMADIVLDKAARLLTTTLEEE